MRFIKNMEEDQYQLLGSAPKEHLQGFVNSLRKISSEIVLHKDKGNTITDLLAFIEWYCVNYKTNPQIRIEKVVSSLLEKSITYRFLENDEYETELLSVSILDTKRTTNIELSYQGEGWSVEQRK